MGRRNHLEVEVPAEEVSGHGRRSHLEQGDQEVTVRGPAGEEVRGHVRGLGEAGPAGEMRLRIELEDDDTVGQAFKRHLEQEGAELTIRFEDSGDEVRGHGMRVRF